jgi:hypothetical protein
MRRIAIEVDETVFELLQTLTRGDCGPRTVKEVVILLIDHAQQGVYRPGAWERDWLCQAFGLAWTSYLEPGDPYGRDGGEHIFQRPKRPRRRNG